jgi:hypothetical protein
VSEQEEREHRYDQVLDVLDHYTPAERAEAFYSIESRWCWDCGWPPEQCQCPATLGGPTREQVAEVQRIILDGADGDMRAEWPLLAAQLYDALVPGDAA